MYKHSFLLLLLLSATALAQEMAPCQPTVVQVSTNSPPFQANQAGAGQESAPMTDLDRYLLKLKTQREALAAEQDVAKKQFPQGVSWEGTESAKLRAHLGQLMNKLSGVPDPKAKTPITPIPPQPLPPIDLGKKVEPIKQHHTPDMPPGHGGPAPAPPIGQGDGRITETPGTADPLALGHVLFKAGNWELALKAYRLVNTKALKADERAPIQYLIAACLRKLGKLDEAATIFREVANIRGDEQVAACAQWQLVQLRWQADFEAQMRDVRNRRKALEAGK